MTTRSLPHSVVGIGVAMVLLVGCSSSEPTPSPTEPSPTTSPSASPSESVTATTAPKAGRDPEMSNPEALSRLTAPQTEETWLDAPRQIASPDWAAGDGYLDQDWVGWYELGTRGGRTIVGFSSETIEEIFERSGTGTWEWIPFPSARMAVGPIADFYGGYEAVPVNASVYYDSLTLPARFTLPTGEPLITPEYDWGSPEVPGNDPPSPSEGAVIDQIGEYDILRFDEPVRWIWADVYPVTEPPSLTYREFFFVLETPYGAYLPLEYAPLGEIDDIDWTIDTNPAPEGYSYLADINDIGCGPRDSDHNTSVFGLSDGDWVEAGTTAGGETVYVPTETNPLVGPMYESYRSYREEYEFAYVSQDDWIVGPALVGYRAPGSDGGEWIVYLNGAYSGRAWC